MFDTDLIIALMRGDDQAKKVFERHKNARVISSFTWYELMVGCCKIKNRSEHLDHLIECLSEVKIMHFDDTIATIAARNHVVLAKKGHQTGVIDNFIAASCIVNNETLITRNIKHFKGVPGLKVEKW